MVVEITKRDNYKVPMAGIVLFHSKDEEEGYNKGFAYRKKNPLLQAILLLHRRFGSKRHWGVMLGARRQNQMVDSGASFCAIDKRIAEKIGLTRGKGQSVTIAPAFGNAKQVPIIRMNSVRIGINMIDNITVTIIDFPTGLNFRGILGMNYLQNFRFTIEPDTDTSVLRKISK
ncbi:clan AA aspartic protease [candidate division KSB1 bacterium]|nr:clan AA aspartic protease [candidate division KSB1 bacterium]NIR72317.1 clan AA aspartic protease [candidate division KSB1 bacterium]NIS26709.1 clan AA aspartic protease [candidate division KSB1 bacterium]NIT73455.1 clan AA aspartic protease [candidate division KSB1 bacterium]NIU27324.1 clan AA aspartic protease [candidate division KSB1 bacterium]